MALGLALRRRGYRLASMRPRVPDDQGGDADEALTLTAAAARFGTNRETLMRALKRGQLPARKVGGVWLVRVGDLVEWRYLGRHRSGPEPAPRPPTRWPQWPRKRPRPDSAVPPPRSP